jgi:hypothetical protein
MDFVNDEIDVYVDGEKTDSVTQLNGNTGTFAKLLTYIQSASEIQIGDMYPWWEVWDYRGYVDDIRMYNKALSQEEVTQLMSVSADTSVIKDENKANEDPAVYVQYKKTGNDLYTVRIIGEVELDGTFTEDVNTSYTGAGFRCAQTQSAVSTADSYASKVVFKSIMANGTKVTAADNKYFIVTEITNVSSTGKIYATPVYTQANANVETFTNTVYTIDMSTIIK